LVAVPFAALGFILSWLIKEIPLRTTAFVASTQANGRAPHGHDGDGDAVHESPVPTSVATSGMEGL
jgi:hypothetical protein